MSSKYAEFRFGWPVVLASAVGIGLGLSPLPFYTIGVFAGPLTAEFGWGTGQVMSALVIYMFGAVLASPVIGLITDRIGPRKVVLASVALFSLAMMSFALLTDSVLHYMVTWVVLAVCGAGTLPMTWTRAVNSWFFDKRGLALGLSLIGTGIFGLLAKHYAFFLIELVGWRMAYVGVGALPLLIAWPLAFFFFRDATDPKVAERVARMEKATARTRVPETGLSLREAFRDWRFWLMVYGIVPISFAVGGPIPNLETLLGSKGFAADQAVTLAGLIGVAVVIGRLVGGYLLDRIWAPAVAATLLSLPAVSTWMLSQPELAFATAAVAILILGIAAGVEFDVLAYLASRYFGLRHYATIYGILYAFFALGAGFGPAVYGALFESTGSYAAILRISSVLFLAGALPLLLLGPYREFGPRSTEPEAVAREGRS